MDEQEGQVMSVKAYADSRKHQPQLVHYYIRKGEIEQFPCPCCGSKVINVAQADAIMTRKGNR